MKTRSRLDKIKCYREPLTEKVVISVESHVVAPGKVPVGILPVGSWMVEGSHKSSGGKCVLVGKSLVEGGRTGYLEIGQSKGYP